MIDSKAASWLRPATFRRAVRFLVAFAALAGSVSPVRAGEHATVWLGATPFAGSLGVVWRAGNEVWVGIEGGGGIPQIDYTFAPEKRDFLGIIHLGGVARFAESSALYFDVGPQVGIGDLDHDPRSGDDMPNLFAGFSSAAMYGGRRWRVGPRLDLVWIFDEPSPSIFVANVTPLTVRVEW